MGKFKVGDKVANSSSPKVLLGQVVCEAFGGYYIEMDENYYAIMPEDDLILYDEIPDMTDDEIYDMLKPKLEKSGAYIDCGYYYDLDSKKAIALAYRSGYLRAKKGRPFKIGGDKE